MRLKLILPRMEPEEIETPTECPYDDCDGRHFRFHQAVIKPLRDTKYPEVTAQRHECLTCGRTFRVYPQGVTRAQTSLRVKGLAVMLYLLGLSYGAVSLAMEALGVYVCKGHVCDAGKRKTGSVVNSFRFWRNESFSLIDRSLKEKVERSKTFV